MKALVFGANGGIGKELCKCLRLEQNNDVVEISRSELNFNSYYGLEKVSTALSYHQPELIFNCTGVFEYNAKVSFEDILNVNLGSNWAIIQHYLTNQQDREIRIGMVGSSAYKSGRKDYMLYSASKAALHNMCEGAAEALPPNILLGLLHPGQTLTKMIRKINPTKMYLTPEYVAATLLDMCLNMQKSQIQELTI